jgi:hypothetical protein
MAAGGGTKKMQALEPWLTGQRAALAEERDAERGEVAEALAQLTAQVMNDLVGVWARRFDSILITLDRSIDRSMAD